MAEEQRLLRMQRLQLALKDLLQDIPASSVEVERSHTSLQNDCSSQRIVPKRPGHIQADSYIAHTTLQHAAITKHLETEVFGKHGKSKVRRVMKGRVMESAVAGNGLTTKRPKLTEGGTVKGRTGLLKGLLSETQPQMQQQPITADNYDYNLIIFKNYSSCYILGWGSSSHALVCMTVY